MATQRFLVPVAQAITSEQAINSRVESLEGLRVGFRIYWPRFEVFIRHLQRRLREEVGIHLGPEISPRDGIGGVTQDIVVFRREDRKQEWESWQAGSDVAILGLGA